MDGASGSARNAASGDLERELAANGFCVVRDVVPRELVAMARTSLDRYFRTSGRYRYGGKCELWGLHILDAVSLVLTSPSVLDVVRRCTSPDPAVLTEECFLIQNTTANWHKDTADDLGLGEEIYRDPGFKVYKIALYLQDQAATSPEVFKVKTGSHRLANGESLPIVPVPMKAGDAVIFDVRIDHAGQLPTVAERSLRKFLNQVGRYLPGNADRWFTRTRSLINSTRAGRPDRLAMIMTFGSDGPHTVNYEAAGRKRQGAPSKDLAAAVRARVADGGVEIIQLDETRSRLQAAVR